MNVRWRDCACGRPFRSRGAIQCPDCKAGVRFQKLRFRRDRKALGACHTLRHWQQRREKECRP